MPVFFESVARNHRRPASACLDLLPGDRLRGRPQKNLLGAFAGVETGRDVTLDARPRRVGVDLGARILPESGDLGVRTPSCSWTGRFGDKP